MTSLKNWRGVACVIGVDWGDSGKGKIIDDLGQRADIVARFNGGSNTGHTINNKHGSFALHIMPSGIFNKKTTCLIGRGVVVDLDSLINDEMTQLKKANVTWKNLMIDEKCTLTMPWHKLRDNLREKYRSNKIGTTARGVGPTYADRIERVGLRIKDLIDKNYKEKIDEEIKYQNEIYNLKLSAKNIIEECAKYIKIIKPFIGDTNKLLQQALKSNKNVLFEGAQGYFLDIDVGTYPFVTSSNTGVVGIWKTFDVYPTKINHVIGITKSYTTRVGEGPMPTIIKSKERKHLIEKGGEVGTTSGRIRDPGWLDLVLLKTACQNNNVNHLAVTKLDVLSEIEKIKICTGYKIGNSKTDYVPNDAEHLAKCKPVYKIFPGWQENISKTKNFKDLPKNAKNYIKYIENFTKVPINFIGTGPKREDVIYV